MSKFLFFSKATLEGCYGNNDLIPIIVVEIPEKLVLFPEFFNDFNVPQVLRPLAAFQKILHAFPRVVVREARIGGLWHVVQALDGTCDSRKSISPGGRVANVSMLKMEPVPYADALFPPLIPSHVSVDPTVGE